VYSLTCILIVAHNGIILTKVFAGDGMEMKLMMRPAEAAEAIGVSRSKAYELISRGEIPSVRVGGCVRVPVEALRQWIDKRLAQRAEDR
jgi:excisionase family DNA binding protein